jgi:hypothetical protein
MHSYLQNETVVYLEGGLYEEQKEADNARGILNYGGHYYYCCCYYYYYYYYSATNLYNSCFLT